MKKSIADWIAKRRGPRLTDLIIGATIVVSIVQVGLWTWQRPPSETEAMTASGSRLRHLALAVKRYTEANDGCLPMCATPDGSDWLDQIRPFLPDGEETDPDVFLSLLRNDESGGGRFAYNSAIAAGRLDPRTNQRVPIRLSDLVARGNVILIASQARGVTPTSCLLDSRGSYPEYPTGAAANFQAKGKSSEKLSTVTLRADWNLVPTLLPIGQTLLEPQLKAHLVGDTITQVKPMLIDPVNSE